MFSLTQQVGSNKLHITVLIGDDAYLGRACRHVYGYIMKADLLLGRHDILIARTENLINLRHRLCTVSHGTDSLNATSLEDFVYACYLRGDKYCWVELPVATWRRAEYYLRTSCNLSRGGKHQNGGEQRCRSSGDV